MKEINLFITGVGNVGSELLNQIHTQKKFLKKNFNLKIKVIALSNTKKMLFDLDGICLKKWKSKLRLIGYPAWSIGPKLAVTNRTNNVTNLAKWRSW